MFEGGAIRHFSLGANKVIHIKNTDFIANYGHDEINTDIPRSLGGALMIENLDHTPARNAQLIVEDSKFIDNVSNIGAAIYSQSFNHKISNCLFSGHHAPLEGGVVYIANSITSNSLIIIIVLSIIIQQMLMEEYLVGLEYSVVLNLIG
ncbi:MAG: hypothetical protein HC912_07655 [Saprospiraceae bacterium]|nr:hypothetical protein [Saprospiraceae bacterium]